MENRKKSLDALSFKFNLHPFEVNKVCKGSFCVFEDSLRVEIDGETQTQIMLSDIKELIVDLGVGCLFVSYVKKADDTVHLLCRSDEKLKKQITKRVKRINHYIESGKLSNLDTGDDNCCPKCGKPYRPGSTLCLYCTDKKKVLRRIVGLLKPHALPMILAMSMYILICVFYLVGPYLHKMAVDDYILANSIEEVNFGVFSLILLLMLTLQLGTKLVTMLRRHILINANNKMIVSLRNKLFDKIQRLSIAKISARTAGDLMQRVTSDTAKMNDFLINYLPTLIDQVAVFVVVSLVMLFYNPYLFLFIILPTPFVVLAFYSFWRMMRGMWHKRWQTSMNTTSVLHDIFSGIRVVKSYGMERREGERFDEAAKLQRHMEEKSDLVWSVIMPFLNFMISFGEFFILYYVGNQVIIELANPGAGMTIGEMAQFSSYASLIYGPLRNFATIPRRYIEFVTSSTKIFEILDEEVDVADAEKPENFEIQGNIDIQNVSFGYDSGKEVLHNINVDIKKGDFIGIVGASGVGKSTLINLIMRMYDVEEGSILVDGVDIRNISQDCLRSQMGVVLQETFLFSGTIYQNIAYAKAGATREEIIRVSKLSGCHNFIMRLPDGYNTKVGERGNTLSGGEKQRIAIARALLHDPKILILDEATASLDTETEKQIQDALANLSKERTTIAIAHRLSTLRNATKLVVLDKGRVAETGSHEELMERQGIYYGLVMAQREMSDMEHKD